MKFTIKKIKFTHVSDMSLVNEKEIFELNRLSNEGDSNNTPKPVKKSSEPIDNEKMSYAKFIDFLEKNDPTGLSQLYYQTLIGKYEKTLGNDGFVEADKKALKYIKDNDPTGFIKYYYEQTALGKLEVKITKVVDEKLDVLDRAADKIFKLINEKLDRLPDFKDLINNNKNLPNVKNKDTFLEH